MIENFDLIAGRLKGVKIGDKELTLDLLKEALSKEEAYKLEAPTVHVMSDSELSSLKDRVKEENKTGYYIEGKEAGSEMLIKALKRVSSIDLESKVKKNDKGEIDFDATAKALNESFEKTKGVEPNKKIQELTESLTNLQKTVEAKENELKSWNDKYTGLEKSTKVQKTILSKMPKNLNVVNADQFSALLQMDGYSIDFTDGGEPFAIHNGKPLKDSLEKYIPVDTILVDYAKKNNWINGGGRGGDDDSGKSSGKFKTINDVFKHMEQNKIDPMSKEGQRLQAQFEAENEA